MMNSDEADVILGLVNACENLAKAIDSNGFEQRTHVDAAKNILKASRAYLEIARQRREECRHSNRIMTENMVGFYNECRNCGARWSTPK